MNVPYINHHYLHDLAVFLGFEPNSSGPSGMLCGATISENLLEYRRLKFNDISAFFCCQYALNLLDYVIRKYFIVDHSDWLATVPPFADSTACSLFHGGVRDHVSMLAYLRRNVAAEGLHFNISDDNLTEWLKFFHQRLDSVGTRHGFHHRLSSDVLCSALNIDGAHPKLTFD